MSEDKCRFEGEHQQDETSPESATSNPVFAVLFYGSFIHWYIIVHLYDLESSQNNLHFFLVALLLDDAYINVSLVVWWKLLLADVADLWLNSTELIPRRPGRRAVWCWPCCCLRFQNNRTVWPPLLLSVPVNTSSPPLLPHKWVTDIRVYLLSLKCFHTKDHLSLKHSWTTWL